jgi:hypothetical protein
MDLLGFFKEKKCFLELKYVYPLKMFPATPDPPKPDPLRSGSPRPACGWAVIGCRMRSREGTVRLGAMGVGMWPRRD